MTWFSYYAYNIYLYCISEFFSKWWTIISCWCMWFINIGVHYRKTCTLCVFKLIKSWLYLYILYLWNMCRFIDSLVGNRSQEAPSFSKGYNENHFWRVTFYIYGLRICGMLMKVPTRIWSRLFICYIFLNLGF